MAEKDEVIKVRENQLEAKGQVLAEKDNIVQELKEQLEEKTKAMELLQKSGGGDQVSSFFNTLKAVLIIFHGSVDFYF